MSAYALDLFNHHRGTTPTRAETPAPPPATAFAPAEDMKRARFVQAIFTFLSPRREPLTIGPCLPQSALARVLDEIERHPRKVSVDCNPATPDAIEIRDESRADAPRYLLAIVHEGLSLAEARTALAALQSNPKPRR